jgi:uncharacterized protein YyaL (SSP411 family)
MDSFKYFFIFSLCLLFPVFCLAQQTLSKNNLSNEKSEYLRQHAQNPVYWNAWRTDVLEKALITNRLMIISIGYSSCHWCHVMERETFSDSTVGHFMNQNFVNIKVDREERPDIDQTYLKTCQLLNGSGCGWPLNVIALPDGSPVWIGTYLPKQKWLEILQYFLEARQKAPKKLQNYAQQLQEGVQAAYALPVRGDKTSVDILKIVQNIINDLDLKQGGLMGQTKFPTPELFNFLLEVSVLERDSMLRQVVKLTLDNVANRGLYDVLGGGFGRYATDSLWMIPHFEKMLYDNAQLINLYSYAYQLNQNIDYQKVIKQTIDFASRDWLDGQGGFYASSDADADSKEGDYYTWTKAEIDKALGANAAVYSAYYGVTAAGNFEQQKNILIKKDNADTTHVKLIENCNKILFNLRNQRIPPHVDKKILTGWNALMITALTNAYNTLGDAKYKQMVLKNAHFLAKERMNSKGQLKRETHLNGFLEDYAYTMQAFLKVYELTFDEKWLQLSAQLADYVLANFRDSKSELFCLSEADTTAFFRDIPVTDGVLPSANAVIALTLQQLGTLLDKPIYLEKAAKMLGNVKLLMQTDKQSVFYYEWCKVAYRQQQPPFEVAIVGENAHQLREQLVKYYLPNTYILGSTKSSNLELLNHKFKKGATWIYVCQNKACKQPVQTVDEALRALRIRIK